MKDLVGKHIFITSDLAVPENGIKRTLRRITRETRTQYIADVERMMFTESKGERNWDEKPIYQELARRYKKRKLFDKQGNITSNYGNITIIDKDYSAMICEFPFEEMFTAVKGTRREDMVNHDMKMLQRKYGTFGFLYSRKKNSKGQVLHPVCLDTESYVANKLKEIFGVDVYYSYRMWDDKRFEDVTYDYYFNRECDFDRNAVLHTMTSAGGDEKIISAEENKKNESVVLWFFKDRIVYKKMTGWGYM